MKVTFENIAGYKREKAEALNICNMIDNFEEYEKLGITLPKGLMLYGLPGVGKTLFAKAIANKVKRTFVEVDLDGDHNLEVDDLLKKRFMEAKESSPSILFIDEIDKLVPVIGFESFNSDGSRKTLTLLLSLLDGFNKDKDVMVIATTNSMNQIPEALTRSGRIDKHIGLERPDSLSREAIISYYLNQIKLEKDVDVKKVSTLTELLTGADIKTIINEAAINNITLKKEKITTADLIKYTQKVTGKQFVKHTDEFDFDKDDKVVAIHELGHFVSANKLKKEIREVSINKEVDSLGRIKIRKNSRLYSKEDIFNEVIILLSGKASEEVFLETTHTGNYDDINKAVEYLLMSVGHGDYGVDYMSFENEFTVRGIKIGRENSKTNEKVRELYKEAYEKAIAIVSENKELIIKLKPILLRERALTGEELKGYVEGTIVPSTVTKDDYLEYIRR